MFKFVPPGPKELEELFENENWKKKRNFFYALKNFKEYIRLEFGEKELIINNCSDNSIEKLSYNDWAEKCKKREFVRCVLVKDDKKPFNEENYGGGWVYEFKKKKILWSIATGSFNKRGEFVRMFGENEKFDIMCSKKLYKYIVNTVV